MAVAGARLTQGLIYQHEVAEAGETALIDRGLLPHEAVEADRVGVGMGMRDRLTAFAIQVVVTRVGQETKPVWRPRPVRVATIT
jgi:hypothetical protein